jgi:microcystin-dependent protein
MLTILRPSLVVAVAVTAALMIPVARPAEASCGLNTFLGQICTFAFNFCPKGFAPAEGDFLSLFENTALFSLVGTYYGGDGKTNFALPDLRGRTTVGTNDLTSEGTTGGGATTVSARAATSSGGVQVPAGQSPFIGLTRCIATSGVFPPRPTGEPGGFNNVFIGEIMTFAGNFCAQGFAPADGSPQSISNNPTMFTLIGTTFGGDGQQTFWLPNLLGATVVGTGLGVGLPNVTLGQSSGNTNTVNIQTAIAKGVQVPATQSPFLIVTPCVSLFGVYPPTQ